MAAWRRIGGRRQFALQAYDLGLARPVQRRHRRQQGLGIGMLGRAQYLVDRAALDDPPQVHHRNLVRQILDHGDVVRDEQVGQAEIALQLFQQIEDLRLHRNVERAGGLVADDQLRLHRQRARDGNALALPAGEFVRIAMARCARQSDLVQQPQHALCVLRAGRIERPHAFLQDIRYPHARVQRGIRILENHLEIRTPAAQRVPAQGVESRALEADFAARLGQQLQDSLARRGFPTAGLTDQRERASCSQLQRQPVHRPDVAYRALEQAALDRKMHHEIAYREQRLGYRRERGLRRHRNRARCKIRSRLPFPEMAANPVPGRKHGPVRNFDPATLPGTVATLGETAAAEFGIQRRHLALDHGQFPTALGGARKAFKQFARIRMLRGAEKLLARGELHQIPGVHHRDPIGHLRHHAQIVGNQQDGHAMLLLQPLQQVEHLRLDGYVQRSRRFVGDQQLRLGRERDGNHHPLLKPSGELKRVFVQAPRGIGHAYGMSSPRARLRLASPDSPRCPLRPRKSTARP